MCKPTVYTRFMSEKNIVNQVCEHFHNQARLAGLLDIKPQSITKWRKKGQIPVDRVGDIARLSKGRFTREQLRPDIFGQAN